MRDEEREGRERLEQHRLPAAVGPGHKQRGPRGAQREPVAHRAHRAAAREREQRVPRLPRLDGALRAHLRARRVQPPRQRRARGHGVRVRGCAQRGARRRRVRRDARRERRTGRRGRARELALRQRRALRHARARQRRAAPAAALRGGLRLRGGLAQRLRAAEASS